MNGIKPQRTSVSRAEALEESFFLGLRLNRGVSLRQLCAQFGGEAIDNVRPLISELVHTGLLEHREDNIRLTSRGRLISNEVFERFLLAEGVTR